ncbi:uncharacterized protein LOC120192535 [Hibiscus syriacus]|uniref:uncharacterized protein LOC120192535 n=1 Tax=Hibiscus syriacus TaxID=106335 RepID=UPI0019231448|nr:uncharacterized protein LOC120192535 [Hibiscus syriacus]
MTICTFPYVVSAWTKPCEGAEGDPHLVRKSVKSATSYPHIEEMVEGIVLTSPALPAVAPFFSLQRCKQEWHPCFEGPRSTTDQVLGPLGLPGPSVTVPFLVLHGTADKVTDPLASQDLYNEAASKLKDIRRYDGFLHDLLFEPESEAIGQSTGWRRD